MNKRRVRIRWMSARSRRAMLPTVLFFLFVQKYMVYEAVAGSVKG